MLGKFGIAMRDKIKRDARKSYHLKNIAKIGELNYNLDESLKAN